MLDEIIKEESAEVTLSDLIWKIVEERVTAAIKERVDTIETNVFDIYDNSYDIGEVALEHIREYGEDWVVEIIDQYDLSDKDLTADNVASGTTFTVTVD